MEGILFGIGALIGLCIALAATLWINSEPIATTPLGYKKKKIDKYLEECGFSPDECKESHLPGDCPLCGAK